MARCTVDVRAHSRKCPASKRSKQQELPLKPRRKKYARPGTRTCDVRELKTQAQKFCRRAGEASALGQKRCLKHTMQRFMRVVPACRRK